MFNSYMKLIIVLVSLTLGVIAQRIEDTDLDSSSKGFSSDEALDSLGNQDINIDGSDIADQAPSDQGLNCPPRCVRFDSDGNCVLWKFPHTWTDSDYELRMIPELPQDPLKGIFDVTAECSAKSWNVFNDCIKKTNIILCGAAKADTYVKCLLGVDPPPPSTTVGPNPPTTASRI